MSHDGMDTTRDRIPAASNASCASTARLTSLPEAIKITSGFPPGASASTYAPRASPDAAAYLFRSSVGRGCRDNGIMSKHKNRRQLHNRRESNSGPRIIAEDKKRRPESPDLGERHTIHNRSHGVLSNSVVQIFPPGRFSLEISRALIGQQRPVR